MDWFAIAEQAAQRQQYHRYVPDALAARQALPQEAPSLWETPVGPPQGRDPVESNLAAQIKMAAASRPISPSLARELLASVDRAGYSSGLGDLTARLRLALRAQQENDAQMRAASPALFGMQYQGWFEEISRVLLA